MRRWKNVDLLHTLYKMQDFIQSVSDYISFRMCDRSTGWGSVKFGRDGEGGASAVARWWVADGTGDRTHEERALILPLLLRIKE